jgi:hypothetical protein
MFSAGTLGPVVLGSSYLVCKLLVSYEQFLLCIMFVFCCSWTGQRLL